MFTVRGNTYRVDSHLQRSSCKMYDHGPVFIYTLENKLQEKKTLSNLHFFVTGSLLNFAATCKSKTAERST